jgi:cell wall-associated NlpC family hydrolase
MGTKAAGGRFCAAAAAFSALVFGTLGTGAASAAGAPPVPPPPPAAASDLPPLPTVPLDITDGQPIQALYAIALSLSSNSALSAKLRSEIAATQKQLDSDSVAAKNAAASQAAAQSRASAAEARATAAEQAYKSLDGALKQAIVFMYTAGPASVRLNPAAGEKLAYAADYAGTALSAGGILSTRKFDASLRKSELAIAKSAEDQAAQSSQQASAAVAGELAAEASLESELAAVVASSRPQLMAETSTLAAQAGQELLTTAGLEFTPAAPLPPPLSTTSVALSWAFAELGKTYVWGATGPDTFDCSGLTQYAWHQAGVDIPRVAADQDSWTVPVPLSQLVPGDLVFFGKSDIHHVGIYIGDGLMINAPHTGDVVRVSSIWWSDLAGFGRVHDAGTPVPVHAAPSTGRPASPAVVPAAGPVPSQTQPPPGWQPQPGSTTPIALGGNGGGDNSGGTGSTTTVPPAQGPGSGSASPTPQAFTTTTTTPAAGATSTTTVAPPGG